MTSSTDRSAMAGDAPSLQALRDLREASCGPVAGAADGAPTVTQDLSENVILTSLDDLHNWARLSSLWPLLYGTACCFIEFAALLGSRFDFDRFGLVPRSSPRQADLLIVAGTVTMKMAPALVRLYEQMPEHETMDDIDLYHPRYFTLPGMSFYDNASSMAKASDRALALVPLKTKNTEQSVSNSSQIAFSAASVIGSSP